MTIGPLFTVFGFLLGRPATMGTCDIFLFLSLCLHLVGIGIGASAAPTEIDAAIGYYLIDIVAHGCLD